MLALDGAHPKFFQSLQMRDVLNGLDLIISHI